MSRMATRRLLSQCSLSATLDPAPASRLPLRCFRPFSNTSNWTADENSINDQRPSQNSPATSTRPSTSSWFFSPKSRTDPSPSHPSGQGMSAGMGGLAKTFEDLSQQRNSKRGPSTRFDMSKISSDGTLVPTMTEKHEEPHHFHIYAARHNTHITFTRPDRTPLISVSCGNIGFRKGGRKHYDSAFQLASYVMGRIQEKGLGAEVKKLEVSLRGFGAGREAVTKALLGTEGRHLRGKVVKVSDATRLKFGGTRSKKPRRLG